MYLYILLVYYSIFYTQFRCAFVRSFGSVSVSALLSPSPSEAALHMKLEAQLALFTNYVIFKFETFYLKEEEEEKQNLLKFGHIIFHSTNRLNVIVVARTQQHRRWMSPSVRLELFNFVFRLHFMFLFFPSTFQISLFLCFLCVGLSFPPVPSATWL